MSVDFIANISIFCIMTVLLSVYTTFVILPPWDDGTGYPLLPLLQVEQSNKNKNGKNNLSFEKITREEIIPAASRWAANLDYQFGPIATGTQNTFLTLSDSAFELRRNIVLRVEFCRQGENSKKRKVQTASEKTKQQQVQKKRLDRSGFSIVRGEDDGNDNDNNNKEKNRKISSPSTSSLLLVPFCVCDRETAKELEKTAKSIPPIVEMTNSASSSSFSEKDTNKITSESGDGDVDVHDDESAPQFCIDDINDGRLQAQLERTFRLIAKDKAVAIESAAMRRLVIRLRYYYQTNAGLDVLFMSIFNEGILAPENASASVRHTMWLHQPRLPPPSTTTTTTTAATGKSKAVTTTTTSFKFLAAERDDRWIHDLVMDPQANALKHAPFVFPVLLTMITCFIRVVVGLVKLMIKNNKTKKNDPKEQQEQKSQEEKMKRE